MVVETSSGVAGNLWKIPPVIAAITLAWLPLFSQSSSDVPSEEVNLQIIVVSSPEEAQGIIERAQKGESFLLLAKQLSIDSTADNGGRMGSMDISTLRPELRDALQGVGPGQLSPVVRTPLGYAILKVVQRGARQNASRTIPQGSAATAATGNVKYTFNVGGFGEAELGLLKAAKSPDWAQDPRQICETRKQSVSDEIAALQEYLAPASQASKAASPRELLNAHFSLAELNAYNGDMQPAIEHFLQAHAIAEADVWPAVPSTNEALGVAYLHKSEMENDVYRAPRGPLLVAHACRVGLQRHCRLGEGHRIFPEISRSKAHRT